MFKTDDKLPCSNQLTLMLRVKKKTLGCWSVRPSATCASGKFSWVWQVTSGISRFEELSSRLPKKENERNPTLIVKSALNDLDTAVVLRM